MLQVQTIGFLSHLRENKINGPYMVVGPLSTLSNWVDEFKRWLPSMNVILYHGSKDERQKLRTKHMPHGTHLLYTAAAAGIPVAWTLGSCPYLSLLICTCSAVIELVVAMVPFECCKSISSFHPITVGHANLDKLDKHGSGTHHMLHTHSQHKSLD